MKKTVLILSFLLSINGLIFADYDPGDLLNSIKRSQMITDIFLERWNVLYNSVPIAELEKKPLQEQFYYINRGGYGKYADLYFHAENVYGFPVKTRFNKTYEMDLFRVALSSIVKFEDLIKIGDFNWGFAFAASGFRYGLYKDVNLNNDSSMSGSSNSFTSTDYLYTQVYDDLLVLTNILKPIGYLHTGLLINQQVNPGIDGIPGTGDLEESEDKSYRLFLNSDLFGSFSFNFGYNSEDDSTDFLTTELDFFSTLQLLKPKWIQRRYLWPDFSMGIAYFDLAADNIPDPETESLYTFFAQLYYNYYNAFYIKTRIETFLYGRTELEKENNFKQTYLEIGWSGKSFSKISRNPERYYGKGFAQAFTYYFITGISYITDSRMTNFGNDSVDALGFTVGLKLSYAKWLGGLSAEGRISRNYSPKLYHLIEAYNTWILEFSLQLGF